MAGSRRSAERVRRGATSGHSLHESRKKPTPHLFLSGLCNTVGVNYREKKHTYCWPHLHRCDRKRTEELTPRHALSEKMEK